MDLHHVMPAQEFFAPLETYKDAIAAALDSIQAGGQRPRQRAYTRNNLFSYKMPSMCDVSHALKLPVPTWLLASP